MDDEELITCKICGKQSTRIYGAHLKSHGLTSKEYLNMFPGSPLYTESDNKETTKNSGKHMKEEKYKKMFSEKIKGDNNPNSKSKTTEEQRKQRSPFSKSFMKYENENEALNFTKNVQKNIPPEKRPVKIEYYLNKGFSREESEKMLSARQKTFTLEKCVMKYGEEKGRKRWLERQEKWLNNYKKLNYSIISQKLFWDVYDRLNNKENIFFATLKDGGKDLSGNNNEFRLILDNIIIRPDFYQERGFKIIEFDGIYYHRKTPENKKRSIERDKEILKSCHQILHISEKDYLNEPQEVLKKCLSFLNLP